MNSLAPKAWRGPLFFSGIVLLSQSVPLPSPALNAATETWAAGYSFLLPKLYLLFAPFCGVAAQLCVLSYHQILITLVYLFLLFFLGLGLKRGTLALVCFLSFAAWGILIPHPMARLIAPDPDLLLIDFHSHTSYSHDGRKVLGAFTPERNMAWHAAQGFGAGFITDHNLIDGSKIAKELSQKNWRETGYRSLEGEEISLFHTHLVTLGVHERIDNAPWDSDSAKVRSFIAEMHRRRIPVIASSPEYWYYDRGSFDFMGWGVNGYEIINSAPRGLNLPIFTRRIVVGFCRDKNLLMTGITDSHGWGYATAAWSAMRIPGWQAMDPDQLELAVLKTLKLKGFGAVEVLERARYNPASYLGLLCSPFIDAGIYWRSLQPLEALSWILWIWLFALIRSKGSYGRKN